MAKYTVNYSCGHGTHTVELFGPGKERERKIAWYEKNIVCPECYKTSKKSEQYQAEVINNMFSGGAYIAITNGDTYSIKEQLKEHGFSWREYYSNNDIFGTHPHKAWMINIPDNDDALNELLSYLSTLGISDIDFKTNPITQSLLAKTNQ